jgi:hypothetical protein
MGAMLGLSKSRRASASAVEIIQVGGALMGSSPPVHDIPLAANRSGNRVTISGQGGASLPKASGAHRFRFTLADPTGLDVEFSSLDTEDNRSTCPPAPGENSTQIVGVTMGPQPRTAAFTDNNDNSGPMDVCYQWHFTCNDPAVQVEPFDPIIRNGGGGP